MNYWLIKSEPFVFSFDDLKKAPGKKTFWDGIRNYQARNLLRDDLKKGDQVLFYHSREKPMCAVGVAEVVKEGYPDHTQFDPKDKYFDAKADPENPRWFMVDIKYKKAFKQPVLLSDMRVEKKLEGMMLLAKGARLSIQPVSKKHFDQVCKMGGL